LIKPVTSPESATRQLLLQAALRSFAERGYAATSVQEIVDAAKVSKPALYYYFADKAQLFLALVDTAHEERHRLMQQAVKRAQDLDGRLIEILTTMFEYLSKNRELMRLAYATAFAAPGELPKSPGHFEKCERNFEFVHSLMKEAQGAGELDKRFDSRQLAYGFYGQMNSYMVSQILMPECVPNRQTAKQIVRLFLDGARKRDTSKTKAGTATNGQASNSKGLALK
jgi:TetR/AcrR family transcriptional regulator